MNNFHFRNERDRGTHLSDVSQQKGSKVEENMRRSGIQLFSFLLFVLSTVSAFALSPQSNTDKNIIQISKKLKNWGLINFGSSKSHIQAPDAWRIQRGNRKVIVAVVDTGIDPNHKSLKDNLWHDPRENQSSVYGWNFVSNGPNPKDEHGHGTHIAGIIGAVADPNHGVSGVSPHVSIMPVKYYAENQSGVVNLKNTIKALNYAIEHGARIINYSGGGPEYSTQEFEAMKRAEAQGILVVAASGNEHQNTDRTENFYYPAAYRLSNIISVASTNMNNNLLSSSNYGKVSVDVGAPGENIFSTLPGDRYGYMSGTSQATAFVTGTAALLLAEDPSLSPQRIKEIIMKSVDHFSQLQGKVASGGRVNAYQALILLRNAGVIPGKFNLIARSPHEVLQVFALPD